MKRRIPTIVTSVVAPSTTTALANSLATLAAAIDSTLVFGRTVDALELSR